MKNYKYLVPIFLFVMYAASIYMLYDSKANIEKKYNTYIKEARNMRELDIRVDAESNYMNALAVKPSLELYIEIGDFYEKTGQTKKAINWGNTIIEKYPKKIEGYEYQMSLLLNGQDYLACFKLSDKFNKRGLSSELMTSYIESIEYEYFFNGEFQDVGVYSGGRCPVRVGDKWGYVDVVGSTRVPKKFVSVGPYINELASVIDQEGKAYFIDLEGNKKFVAHKVDNVVQLGLIENGIYSLYNGKTWGFYDKECSHLFGEYDDVSSIGNGVAAVKKNGNWSFVDREGKDLTGKTYRHVAMDEKLVVYRNDRMFVSDGTGYQMIDSHGNVVGNKKYQAVHIFNDTTYAAVMINDKWGFINSAGEIVIEPKYEDARSFANGYAAVKVDDRWGFINVEGKMVISPQFLNAKDFNDHGGVFVRRNDDWELLRLYKNNY